MYFTRRTRPLSSSESSSSLILRFGLNLRRRGMVMPKSLSLFVKTFRGRVYTYRHSRAYTVASVGALIGADICDAFSGMASFLYTCTRYER